MKVIEINATYGFASTGLIVKDLESMLVSNGHECAVAYQVADEKPKSGIKVGNLIDQKWHAFWTRIYGAQGYASKSTTKRLTKWIKRQNPDIVHLHNLHSNYINLKILLRFLAKEKIHTILTLHDCWFFTGKCTHFIEENCYKWKTQCKDCPRKNKDAKSIFFDKSRKAFSDKKELFGAIPDLTVVACSDWMKDVAEQSFFSGRRIERIHNGIETSFFTPDKRDKPSNMFTILGDGNKWLSKENIELFKTVASNLNEDEELVLYGLRKEHFELIKEYQKVKGEPFTKDKTKMASLFANADVFVNVTHADTLPTVNMEATSSGTPVVTFDSCGSPELVVDCETGYVVKENDVNGIIEAIKKVKDGKISRQDCREFALSSFDKQKNYLEYLELFKSILG